MRGGMSDALFITAAAADDTAEEGLHFQWTTRAEKRLQGAWVGEAKMHGTTWPIKIWRSPGLRLSDFLPRSCILGGKCEKRGIVFEAERQTHGKRSIFFSKYHSKI